MTSRAFTVPNFRPRAAEKFQYITPDGEIFELYSPPNRYVLMYEGDGFAPVSYSTTRGPFQHGDTVVEGRLQARTIDLVIRQMGCDRDAYWSIRDLVDNILRPNRTDMNNPSPGVLRRVLSNSHVRDLDCYVTKGPEYVFPKEWDSFSIQESLRFTGYNPIFYDPELIVDSVSNFTAPPVTDLTFPFTMPFVFGPSVGSFTKTLTINYAGSWEEYPKILITGPATDLIIQHQTLGDTIKFTGFTIPAGTTVTVDLTYAKKSVLDNFGVSWLGRISEDSDLVSFRLEADPVVPNAVNKIDVTCLLGTTDTRIEFQYKNRYVGVS